MALLLAIRLIISDNHSCGNLKVVTIQSGAFCSSKIVFNINNSNRMILSASNEIIIQCRQRIEPGNLAFLSRCYYLPLVKHIIYKYILPLFNGSGRGRLELPVVDVNAYNSSGRVKAVRKLYQVYTDIVQKQKELLTISKQNRDCLLYTSPSPRDS